MIDGTGLLYVCVGPSGAGKGTVLSIVKNSLPSLCYSVSATTRAPRKDEIDGSHYFFISRERFLEMIDKDMFLEYAKYVDHYYGTPVEPVRRALDGGRDVLLEIDMQGALAVKERMPEAVMLFIVPPCFEELRLRLEKRRTEDAEKIEKRLSAARDEYKLALKNEGIFDYIIVNDDPERAACEVVSVMTAERCKTKKRKGYLEIEVAD